MKTILLTLTLLFTFSTTHWIIACVISFIVGCIVGGAVVVFLFLIFEEDTIGRDVR